MRTKYKYQVGEVVNGTLKIIEQTRHGKQNRKGYIVQSVNYPDAPVYSVLEEKLYLGQGCAYTSGRRVYEGNSIYSIERLRPYLVDIEEAKTITCNSRKKVRTKCPGCEREKYVIANKLTNRPYNCPVCTKGTSYPELVMLIYLEVKGIEYEYQKVFDDLPNRRFDFYTENYGIIETHGLQHYEDSGGVMNYRASTKSDKEKQEYCKENSIPYIEIDARESSFTFIRDNINRSILPSITKEEEQLILNRIECNKRYPVKEIVKLYKEGKSTVEIGELYNINHKTVGGILRKCNVTLNGFDREYFKTSHSKRVRCTTTGKDFNSTKEAENFYNLNSTGGITRVCKGEREYSGTYKGKKLKWVYINEEEK